MRVLTLTHVFPRAPDDPQAPFLLTWARALRSAGAEVAVVAPHDAGLPSAHHVDGIAVRLARYAPDRWERLAYRGEMHQLARSPAGPPLVGSLVVALARALRAAARAGAPDVVHVHWWVPGAIAARLAKVDAPVVLTVHGTDVALVESRHRLAPLARWAIRCADRVEAVSSDLAQRLERATGRAADAVNPMPLEPASFMGMPTSRTSPPNLASEPTPHPSQPLKSQPLTNQPLTNQPESTLARQEQIAPADAQRPGAPLLLAVGRMVPEKGFADLVTAASRLDRSVRVEVVGDGPERDRLAAQAAELGVGLDLPGRLAPAQLRERYRAADVVVQPSHREGFGLVAAEALLAGVPVVATDSGGVRDFLDPQTLVPPGSPVALAGAIDRALTNRQALEATAASARERVRGLLEPSAAARRTLEGYEQLRAP